MLDHAGALTPPTSLRNGGYGNQRAGSESETGGAARCWNLKNSNKNRINITSL